MTMAVYVVCKKDPSFKLRITNIANQRQKESNRISAMVENISKVADIEEEEDGITVRGGIEKNKLEGVEGIVFESHNDHRVAMSMAVLSAELGKLYPHKRFIVT